MVAVEFGGKKFTGVTPNAADARIYEAVDGERLASRDAHHSTRAPLVHWQGNAIHFGSVLAGIQRRQWPAQIVCDGCAIFRNEY